jgi:hypothetical protein
LKQQLRLLEQNRLEKQSAASATATATARAEAKAAVANAIPAIPAKAAIPPKGSGCTVRGRGVDAE